MQNHLRENIFSLFTLKGAEYVISFITLPYLLRVLGPEKYGAMAFAQVLVNYGVLLVDYGFNLTAPRDIAKAEPQEIPRHFSAIMGAKLVLLLPILLIGMVLLKVFSTQLDALLVLCFLPMLIGSVLFPIWYFQGIQQMKYITILNLVARIISVAGIFLLVHESMDYRMAAFLQSFTPLLAGILSLGIIHHQWPEMLCVPAWADIVSKLQAGWDIFISTLFTNLYTNSNVFFLGLLCSDTVVGYYAAANKLIESVKGLLAPVSNAVFPHVSQLVKESQDRAVIFLRKMVKIIGGGSLAISLCVFIFADPIVNIIMGTGYEDSVLLLRIISFLPFIIGLSNIFGIQTMVVFGMQRIYSRIIMVSAIMNCLLVFPMIYMWKAVGLAITVVLVESFVTIAMYFILKQNKINLLWYK